MLPVLILSRQRISRICFSSFFLLLASITILNAQPIKHTKEKTSFQTGPGFEPRIDVRSDIAMVYGYGSDFTERIKSWKDQGYIAQFMTGIAWGGYEDYFNGKYDGKRHDEDGQMDKDGNVIWHNEGVPYIIPSESYIQYFKTIIKKVIDSGITSIYLEEPEIWTKSGYSVTFKNEWQKFYGTPWRPQHESAEAYYLSSKLKYQLYYNALKEVISYAQTYGKSKGADIKCYVATHSLINYTAWGIVSPEASLASLPGMDGYIAQVWTGTARTPNYFNGVKKERVFENAFLEYNTMVSMTAPTHKKIFLLTDPIEDGTRTWDDYKKNYQATFTAQLMFPMVNNYEVMPWPGRIYLGKFKLENNDTPQSISKEYATQMQVMVNALNDMPLSKNKVSGSHGIGVLLSNSLMFQRIRGGEEEELSNLYGIVMPLLKRGIPLQTVHMENLKYNPLKDVKVLVMTYSCMKPHSPGVHKYLAEWVKKGGVVIYVGRDNDPFQTASEWWNTNGNRFKTPLEHLLKTIAAKNENAQNVFDYGKGKVIVMKNNPREFVVTANNDSSFVRFVKDSYEGTAKAGKLIFKNSFLLERGAYDVVSVMDEMQDTTSLRINGPVIDLFNPELPILAEKIIKPSQQAFLYNLNRVAEKNTPKVLCAASRVYNEKRSKGSFSFVTKSPSETWNVMRILLPGEPKQCVVCDMKNNSLNEVKNDWDEATKTLRLKFPNSSDGVQVQLKW